MIDTYLRKLFFYLVAVVLFLLFMHIFPNDIFLFIDSRFDLNAEANIPAWYSTVLLFSVSISSFINHLLKQKFENIGPGNRFWLMFGAVYCFLSLDEAARIHEFLNYIASVKWVYLYAPFSAIFFVICVRYFFVIRKNDKTLRNWVIGGLLIYAIGGLGLEFVSYIVSLPPLLQLAEFVLEEGFEIGTVMVLMGSLHEMQCLIQEHFKLL